NIDFHMVHLWREPASGAHGVPSPATPHDKQVALQGASRKPKPIAWHR
ncbi:MAG: hypothetical protein RLZZ619_1204, partial [Pseudomonadota bacterium]